MKLLTLDETKLCSAGLFTESGVVIGAVFGMIAGIGCGIEQSIAASDAGVYAMLSTATQIPAEMVRGVVSLGFAFGVVGMFLDCAAGPSSYSVTYHYY